MKIVFRTDASANIGTGHVMRCIALAQAVKEAGGEALFACAAITPALKDRLKHEKCALTMMKGEPYGKDDAKETVMIAKKQNADWIVVDGYHFDAAYQEELKKAGLRVLFVDDFGHAKSYTADLVLNQNASAKEEWYKRRNSETKLLLGPQFAMLRQEFRARKKRMERSGDVRHVVITFGGADTQNITGKALAAMENVGFSGTISVIIGKSNPHADALRAQATSSKGDVRIVDDADMPAMLASADCAISAAGTTAWELLYMGVPFITGAFAENQIAVAEALGSQNLAVNAGWYPDLSEDELAGEIQKLLNDEERRVEYSRKGMETVDGDGVLRVLTAMSGSTLTLRKATKDDAKLLHEWANDPTVRASAFSTEQIPWESHKKWFEEKMKSKTSMIWIGMDEEIPVGQIRFDVREDGEAEIDVHTAPDQKGKGYGTQLITEGLKKIDAKTVHAYAKVTNEASKKVFLKAGFVDQGVITMKGEQVHHLLFKKS